MGYVEDIQKINKLAKELLQHGMAESLDEACLKAKQMLSKSDGNAVVENTDSPAPVDPPQPPQMTWQEAMTKNNEYIVRHLKEFKQQMSTVVQDIQDLRKQMQRAAPPPQAQTEITIEEPEKSVVTIPSSKEEDHPKQGGFNTDDVAIDKMFYYGNK